MPLDPTFLIFAAAAVLFAGISKGGFGSGAAFAAAPLLALVIEPGLAVGLMLPLLMVMDVGALKPYWKQWDWPTSRALILGSIPGIAFGALFLGWADPDLFRLLIGLIALAFVAYQLLWAGRLASGERKMPGWAGLISGAVAGLTSFISHAGGPPAAIFMLGRRLDKTTYQATSVLVFWAINLLKLGPYIAIGLITWDMGRAWLILAPVALIGVWLGVWLHRVIPEQVYFRLVYVLLVITGSKLIWDALT